MSGEGIHGGVGGRTARRAPALILKNMARPWTTASTLGTLDTGGDVNFYVEDYHLQSRRPVPDIDDHGRFVLGIASLMVLAASLTALPQLSGGRAFEYYDNRFLQHLYWRNHYRTFWCRAGHGIFTNNFVSDARHRGTARRPARHRR